MTTKHPPGSDTRSRVVSKDLFEKLERLSWVSLDSLNDNTLGGSETTTSPPTVTLMTVVDDIMSLKNL